MSIYDQKQVEQLRKRYPKGTRLCLDFMDEPGMPPGLQGTVAYIDDAGQIHMHWETFGYGCCFYLLSGGQAPSLPVP